jgi:hypothetical protein
MNGLYQSDYYVWAHRQAGLLRSGDFAQLDLEHLAAEVLDLAQQQCNELSWHVNKLLHYFLKSALYPERVSGRWLSKLYRHRRWIRKLVHEMPTMAPLLDGYINTAYTKTAERLTAKARLPRSAFPEQLAYTKEQLLEQDFMPWTTISPTSTTPTR